MIAEWDFLCQTCLFAMTVGRRVVPFGRGSIYCVADRSFTGANMPKIESLFVTRLYCAALSEHGKAIDPNELEQSCLVIAEDDEAGQQWSLDAGTVSRCRSP